MARRTTTLLVGLVASIALAGYTDDFDGAELEGQIQSRQARVEAVRSRAQRITDELQQLQGQVSVDQSAVREARQRLQDSVDRMNFHDVHDRERT